MRPKICFRDFCFRFISFIFLSYLFSMTPFLDSNQFNTNLLFAVGVTLVGKMGFEPIKSCV